MRLRKLLEVIHRMDQGVVIALGDAGLEQMQQDLCVLGVVLIPGVIEGIACPGHGQRRNQAQFKPALMQKICKWPVIGAGGFKPNEDRRLKGVEPVA